MFVMLEQRKMYGQGNQMNPDKFVEQMLIQAIQALMNQDYETGVHFLNQISTNYARFMYQLSPSYRNLCKEIKKLMQGGALVQQRALTDQPLEQAQTMTNKPTEQPARESQAAPESMQPSSPTQNPLTPKDEPQTTGEPQDFMSELSSVVKGVHDKKKEKKKKNITDKMTGSLDDLEEFDF